MSDIPKADTPLFDTHVPSRVFPRARQDAETAKTLAATDPTWVR